MEEYYKILGISQDASAEEIRQAYHDLIRVWNPDRFSDDKRLQEKAKRKLNEIISAYTAIATSRIEFKPQPLTIEAGKTPCYSSPVRPVVAQKGLGRAAEKKSKAVDESDEALAFASKMLRTMLVAFLIALPVSLYFFVTRGGFSAIASFVVILAVVIPFMLKRR